MNVQHRPTNVLLPPQKDILNKENANPLQQRALHPLKQQQQQLKKPTTNSVLSTKLDTHDRKRKFQSFQPQNNKKRIEVFEEPAQAKRRRLSVDSDASDDLMEMQKTSKPQSSNEIVSMRQQLIDSYEQKLKDMHNKFENTIRALEEKLKAKEADAHYFGFMYETAKEEAQTVSDSEAKTKKKLATLERLYATLDDRLKAKSLEVEALKEENQQLKETPDVDIIMRDTLLQKRKEQVEELSFRNELLMQQVADYKRKSDKKEEEISVQNKTWSDTITSLKSQMQTALTLSAQKIKDLETELTLERKKISSTVPATD